MYQRPVPLFRRLILPPLPAVQETALDGQLFDGHRKHDNRGNHPLDLCVSSRIWRRDLLHSRDRPARRWGAAWRSLCRVAWIGRDRYLRGPRLVAHTNIVNDTLYAAFLHRPCDLTYANLPGHLATSSPV